MEMTQVLPRSVVLVHPHRPTGLTRRILGFEWKAKWQWMIYNEHQGGMLCFVCTKYGKPLIQACGAWVTRAINNWPKATDLLQKHESCEWHLAALEEQGMALLGQRTGNVLDGIIAASDEEKRRNREVIKTGEASSATYNNFQ